MQTFNQRYGLSDIVSDRVFDLFDPADVELVEFGFENIFGKNEAFSDYSKTQRANMSHSSMLVKFAPDFVLLKKTEPQDIFFLEIKASKTPLRYYPRLDTLRKAHPDCDLKLSDIGEIAREAWNAYNNVYPNTIILDACTYNSKVFMAQFVSKIKCLRCYDDLKLCENCPVKAKGFFPYERNDNAHGSKTPHTNISYASFEKVENFFSRLGIRLNGDCLSDLINTIKSQGVYIPSDTPDYIKEKVLRDLKNEGCDWL